ncbi:glycoside hydrolase family 19 protein [Parapedobacter lycopersici]|uniref:glycoside hydrolase family 19 protein n=1 Tax=Parapedobacter lycopersici TaxID=1864939 RepID=UPI00333F1CC8
MRVEILLNGLRLAPFIGSLSDSKVEGMCKVADMFRLYGPANSNFLAYILATAFHESGGTMAPVREGFAKTDAEAIRIVTSLYNAKRIRKNYALPDPATGKSYFGRGLVQLTWKDNYKRIGNLLGIDLLNNPDLALDPEISAIILVRGMLEGWFTGRKLKGCVILGELSYKKARSVVNGSDQADKIAQYAYSFEKNLRIYHDE